MSPKANLSVLHRELLWLQGEGNYIIFLGVNKK